ncbi:hypothetical protein ISCGN_015204 [Ixodes scapularis]
MAAAASSPVLPTHNEASAAALLPAHNHTAPADTHTTTENPREFDAFSGRTIQPPSPWQRILRERRNFKQAATTPPLPAPRTQPTSPRTAPAPRLPDTDCKIIYRPRAGLRVAAWNDRQMTQSIQQESKIPDHPNHRKISFLQARPTKTVRGVIHGLDRGTTTEQLPYILAPNGPSILHARMRGASTSAVVDFEEPHLPFYIQAYGLFKRCRPYRQTVQCCSLCGDLGHRRDVCPTPDTLVCAQCRTKNPTPDHDCAPTCQLCGLDHPTASKDCREKFRPSPPPLRARERASPKQQTFHNPPNSQTQSTPQQQHKQHFQRSTQHQAKGVRLRWIWDIPASKVLVRVSCPCLAESPVHSVTRTGPPATALAPSRAVVLLGFPHFPPSRLDIRGGPGCSLLLAEELFHLGHDGVVGSRGGGGGWWTTLARWLGPQDVVAADVVGAVVVAGSMAAAAAAGAAARFSGGRVGWAEAKPAESLEVRAACPQGLDRCRHVVREGLCLQQVSMESTCFVGFQMYYRDPAQPAGVRLAQDPWRRRLRVATERCGTTPGSS